MAYSFHANQYENAYNNTRMSNWCVPKAKDRTAKLPKFREGSSFCIANDRGHLKPGASRSKESPWGTFMGTWDMPHHIPNPYVHATGRQPEAAKKLLNQVKASPLNHVRNGFVPHPLFPHCTEKLPGETDEERCRRLQSFPLVSPPLSQTEAESPPDRVQEQRQPEERTGPSLEPCPGSRGMAGPSPLRECPTRPVPQQYPQEHDKMQHRSPLNVSEQQQTCAEAARQRVPEVGTEVKHVETPPEKQECKPSLIG